MLISLLLMDFANEGNAREIRLEKEKICSVHSHDFELRPYAAFKVFQTYYIDFESCCVL